MHSRDVGDSVSYMTTIAGNPRGQVRHYDVRTGPNSSDTTVAYSWNHGGPTPFPEFPTRTFAVLENGSMDLVKSVQYFVNYDAILRSNGGLTFGDGDFGPNTRFGFWEGDQTTGQTGFSQQIFAIPATGAFAQDINGGTSWGGWQDRGQSTDLGIYASGSTTGVYDIYTTSFLFDGQTVSGSPAFGPFHTGPMDLSGWNAGARIFGVGIEAVSGVPVFSGSGAWPIFPVITFDLASDSYQAASTVGGTDGRTSPTTYARAGDFSVQLNGDNNKAYRPNGMLVHTDDGSFWGGTGSFTSFFNTDLNTTVWPHVRSFYDPSNGSWQALFNLDTLQTIPGFGTIGDDFRIGINSVGGTVAVLDVGGIPTPGAMAVLGLAGLAAARRRR